MNRTPASINHIEIGRSSPQSLPAVYANAEFLQYVVSADNATYTVIIMILPFFLIRYQGVPLSMKAYIGTIKHLLRNHAIGKLTESFGISWEKRVYLMITVSFYVLQVYQNTFLLPITRNMVHIHKQLFAIRSYIDPRVPSHKKRHK